MQANSQAAAAEDVYNFNAELEDITGEYKHISIRWPILNSVLCANFVICLLADKKSTKTRRKVGRTIDLDVEIKKEYACDNCDKSFTTIVVSIVLHYKIIHLSVSVFKLLITKCRD